MRGDYAVGMPVPVPRLSGQLLRLFSLKVGHFIVVGVIVVVVGVIVVVLGVVVVIVVALVIIHGGSATVAAGTRLFFY